MYRTVVVLCTAIILCCHCTASVLQTLDRREKAEYRTIGGQLTGPRSAVRPPPTRHGCQIFIKYNAQVTIVNLYKNVWKHGSWWSHLRVLLPVHQGLPHGQRAQEGLGGRDTLSPRLPHIVLYGPCGSSQGRIIVKCYTCCLAMDSVFSGCRFCTYFNKGSPRNIIFLYII